MLPHIIRNGILSSVSVKHHEDYCSLTSAAKNGCDICRAILKGSKLQDIYHQVMQLVTSGFKADIQGWDTILADEDLLLRQDMIQLRLSSRCLNLKDWRGSQDPVIQSDWSQSYIIIEEVEPSSRWFAKHRETKENLQNGRLLINLDETPTTAFQIAQTDNRCLVQIAEVKDQDTTSSAIFCPLVESLGEEGLYRLMGVVEVPDVEAWATKD